jgi:cell division protein FtsB
VPTRLKRPSIWRALAVTTVLVAFQGYLGYNALRGQFGIDSRRQMALDIEELQAKSASLKADIDAYRHKVDLFDAARLDPDILTERARALLSMAQPDDLVVMVDPTTDLPISGSSGELAEDQLFTIIAASSEQ